MLNLILNQCFIFANNLKTHRHSFQRWWPHSFVCWSIWRTGLLLLRSSSCCWSKAWERLQRASPSLPGPEPSPSAPHGSLRCLDPAAASMCISLKTMPRLSIKREILLVNWILVFIWRWTTAVVNVHNWSDSWSIHFEVMHLDIEDLISLCR